MNNILSIDIGLKRIGIAISQDGKIAIPLRAVIRKNRDIASNDVRQIIKNWNINKLIVGIPNGSNRDEMERRFKHFVSLLKFDNEIIYENEELTSFEAEQILGNEIRHSRDGRIDSLSAKIILEQYLQRIKNISYN